MKHARRFTGTIGVPTSMGSGLFSDVLVMLASGARTSIRQRISQGNYPADGRYRCS